MVLGFDNAALVVAITFAAVVLKPSQIVSIGRQTGRALGWAVGHLSLLQQEISKSPGNSEIAKIHQEVQSTLSTLHSIQHEIHHSTRIFPRSTSSATPPAQQDPPPKDSKVEVQEPLPISAQSLGMTAESKPGGFRYGSEILTQAILEEEIATRAQKFMETGDPKTS